MNRVISIPAKISRRPITPFVIRHLSAKPKALTIDVIDPRVVNAQYAVRGEMVVKALNYQKTLRDTPGSLPFEKTISCNIGNPQELGQKPMTFHRQVLALVSYPDLINDPKAAEIFPADAIARAQKLLSSIPGGSGAYSNSQGINVIRETVAKFIEERDGVKADPDEIFITDGASAAVQIMLQLMVSKESDVVLVPIPQYPLYSAAIALNGGTLCGYYLNEKEGWGMDCKAVKEVLQKARNEGKDPKSLVVINPGNPTGQCLSEANMKEVLAFCHAESLVLMADEVYQENIWHSREPWVSFKKVLHSMGEPFVSEVELISFHSVSKGFLGECGRRGGYMELSNIDPDVKAQIYKVASINLCSNVDGQIMVDLMCDPPKPESPSYPLYKKEKGGILESLKRRAKKLVAAYNDLEGITCNESDGALYAFPRIVVPEKAVEAAKAAGKAPDLFYTLAMLDATGVVVVPGSGFGQEEGTFHFRSTILPPETEIDQVIERTKAFHNNFMDQYRE